MYFYLISKGSVCAYIIVVVWLLCGFFVVVFGGCVCFVLVVCVSLGVFF